MQFGARDTNLMRTLWSSREWVGFLFIIIVFVDSNDSSIAMFYCAQMHRTRAELEQHADYADVGMRIVIYPECFDFIFYSQTEQALTKKKIIRNYEWYAKRVLGKYRVIGREKRSNDKRKSANHPPKNIYISIYTIQCTMFCVCMCDNRMSQTYEYTKRK